MTRFGSTAAIVALLFGCGAAPLAAQTASPSQGSPDGALPDPQGEPSTPTLPPPPDVALPAPPSKPGDALASEADAQGEAVDDLLARLATTEDAATARRIASAVQALWLRSGSDTADLLTQRAMEAQRKAKAPTALKLLDAVIGIKPDFAEGWNRRATLHFLAKDYDQAMADIHETLIREPRHFGAWVGLGRILRESGLDKPALGAYRKALAVYPAIDGLKKEVDELALKVEGRPI